MGRLAGTWHRFRALVRRDEMESGLDEEIRFHIEQQTEKNRKAGMPADEARRQAFIRFGGVERARESARDEFRLGSIEDAGRDLRYAVRGLRRAPLFSAVSIVTLALGVGASAAMFSVVKGVVLSPLPYPGQDRLIELVHEAPAIGIDQIFASVSVYFGYRDHAKVFESVGLWDWDRSPVTVTGGAEPESVQSLEVTHEILPMLGATPMLGRGFTEVDDVPGSPPTVVISHGYWQRRFGGADALGETLTVDGIPRRVIGVLPQWFRFFDYPADVFCPLQPVRATAAFPSGDGRGIARLAPGITLAEANVDVARVIPILDEEYPGGSAERVGFAPKLRWLRQSVVGNLGATLWLLMGTTGLLLLVACSNVSNLMLVRTRSRKGELAIRTALGAGWAAVARVVLAEGVVLGLIGGTAGVVVAYLALPFLLSLGAEDLPGIMSVSIDRTVLAVALATSVAATLLFALIPVFHFAVPKLRMASELGGRARSMTEGREAHRTRQSLVVVQVALALVLLIGCGLMIRSFVTLRGVDPGFRDPETVQTFQLTIPPVLVTDAEHSGDHDAGRTVRLQQNLLDRLMAVPGVEAVGFTSSNDGLPLDGDGRTGTIDIEGQASAAEGPRLKEMQAVSPGFFETMRTPLRAGRTFDWDDVHQRRAVVQVSESLARAEWGAVEAAVGKRIRTSADGPWLEVVGVVADVRHDGMNQPPPEVVISPAFARNTIASFVVRSPRVGTVGFVEDLHQAVWSVNGNLSLAGIRTIADMYEHSMARTAMTLKLLAITGALALLLGLVGIYGTVSYAVSERRREIGIRLALGARSGQVRRMFVRRALVLVGIGVAIGLGAASGLTRLMASQLFGVSPLDPATHAVVAALLVVATAAASYLSACRATSLDPASVLKGQ